MENRNGKWMSALGRFRSLRPQFCKKRANRSLPEIVIRLRSIIEVGTFTDVRLRSIIEVGTFTDVLG